MKTKLLAAILHIPILLFLLFSNASLSSAQGSGSSECKPYSIPLDPVACGQGYTGVKFPLKVKTCPGGVVTTGQTFNTDNCRRVGETSDPNATNCALTPMDIACTSTPSPMGCPAGQHWVTTGSGIAHCVQNDFPCPWGQSLQHDYLGNPFCVPNTCPSNQVLQPDGISCACSAGLVWDGASCIAACTPSTTTETASCSAGFTGTMSRTVTNTCPFGTPSYGAWNTSSCVPNVVSCPADDYIPTACSSGSGTAYRWYTYSGPSCTRTFMGIDESGCSSTPPSCPPDDSFVSSCGAGFTGQQVTSTTYSGASCTPSSYTDRSACVPVDPSPSCPVDSVTYQSCPVGYSGSKTVTTSYSGASCTASSSTVDNCVLNPVVCPAPVTNTESCPAGWAGTITTTTTYEAGTCTPNVSVVNACVEKPPADLFTETIWSFWSGTGGQPGEACSFQTWLLKYKNGVKYGEEMISYNPGYISGGFPFDCILY